LLYATGDSLGPPESSTQTASRSLQPFLQGSLGDRPTDKPTDHAIRSLTIAGAHCGEAKCVIVYGYYKYLLEQSTRHIGSTSTINQQLYSAVRRERFPPAYSTGNSLCYAYFILGLQSYHTRTAEPEVVKFCTILATGWHISHQTRISHVLKYHIRLNIMRNRTT